MEASKRELETRYLHNFWRALPWTMRNDAFIDRYAEELAMQEERTHKEELREKELQVARKEARKLQKKLANSEVVSWSALAKCLAKYLFRMFAMRIYPRKRTWPYCRRRKKRWKLKCEWLLISLLFFHDRCYSLFDCFDVMILISFALFSFFALIVSADSRERGNSVTQE